MKTIFCQFLDSQDKDGTIKIKPYTPQYDEVEKVKVPEWVSKLVF